MQKWNIKNKKKSVFSVKKGFTLIEIIISIGLILIIGIISIFSFNITKKKEIENNLRNKSTENINSN